jgi:hypothetical protein
LRHVNGGSARAIVLAQVRDLRASCLLAQNPDYLLFHEPARLHLNFSSQCLRWRDQYPHLGTHVSAAVHSINNVVRALRATTSESGRHVVAKDKQRPDARNSYFFGPPFHQTLLSGTTGR